MLAVVVLATGLALTTALLGGVVITTVMDLGGRADLSLDVGVGVTLYCEPEVSEFSLLGIIVWRRHTVPCSIEITIVDGLRLARSASLERVQVIYDDLMRESSASRSANFSEFTIVTASRNEPAVTSKAGTCILSVPYIVDLLEPCRIRCAGTIDFSNGTRREFAAEARFTPRSFRTVRLGLWERLNS